MKKWRFLAWCLVVAMLMSMVPTFAADGTNATTPSGVLDGNYTLDPSSYTVGSTFNLDNVLNWQLGEASEAHGLQPPTIGSTDGVKYMYYNNANSATHPHLVTTNGFGSEYVWEFTVQKTTDNSQADIVPNWKNDLRSGIHVLVRGGQNALVDWPTSPRGIWFSIAGDQVGICQTLGTYVMGTSAHPLLDSASSFVTYRISDNGSAIVLSARMKDGAWESLLTLTGVDAGGSTFTATNNMTGTSQSVSLPTDSSYNAVKQGGSILGFWNERGFGEFRIAKSIGYQVGAAEPAVAAITAFDLVNEAGQSIVESATVGTQNKYDTTMRIGYRTIDVKLKPGVALDTTMKLAASASFQNPIYTMTTANTVSDIAIVGDITDVIDLNTTKKVYLTVRSKDGNVGTRYLLNVTSQEPVSAGTYTANVTGTSFDLDAYIKENLPETIKEIAATIQYSSNAQNGVLSNGVYTVAQTLAGTYQETLSFTVLDAQGNVVGKNGTVSVNYTIAKELKDITFDIASTILDVDTATSFNIYANYTNSSSIVVTPDSVVSSNTSVISISGNTLNALEAGTSTITAVYSENGVTQSASFEATVVAGEQLGNVLNKAVSCVSATNLNGDTLAQAKALLADTATVAFSTNKLTNGSVTAVGIYTPEQKTVAGSYHDSINFYAKNAAGQTIGVGTVTVSYIVEETFTIAATPATINKGETATLSATYALSNGYSVNPEVTYVLASEGVVTLDGATVTAVNYGSVEVKASYNGVEATTTVKVSVPEIINMPDGKTPLYTKDSGMTVVLEEYSNYYDYMDGDYVGNTTAGGQIVVARVFMHDKLSFNPVGVALQFDETKLVPMNYDNRSGDVRYKFGDSKFDVASAVENIRETDSVYVSEILTDAYGTNYIYGLIATTGQATVLNDGDEVQVMTMLFVKTDASVMVDETVLNFYDGADAELRKAYKTDWGNSGKTISHISGVPSENEMTIAEAFEIVYPEIPTGEDLGNVLNKAASCTGTTELYDETLEIVQGMLDGVTSLTFSANKLSNGSVTAEGAYTPEEKTTANSYHDSVTFYAKNAAGQIIGSGTVTLSYIITGSFTIEVAPAEIAKGETATLLATYALSNGYSITPSVTYTMEANSIATLSGNTVTGVEYGTVTISAEYNGMTATTTVTVAAPSVIYMPDGTTPLYTKGSGMEIIMEEYANYYDYMDGEYIGNTTEGGSIVVARVFMKGALSFNPVGVALTFDETKLVPMNYDNRSGDVRYKYGDAKFDVAGAVENVRDVDSVYITEILTDKFGTNYIYGLVASTGASTVLAAGEEVQIMTILFAKTDASAVVDASAVTFYDGADLDLAKAYRTDWGNSGKSIIQIAGLSSDNETAIPNAFTIVYPEAPATVTGIEVSVDDAMLYVGETATLSAKAIYSDGTEKDIEAVFTVDAAGTIDGNVFTATEAGTATVTAAYGDFTATVEINVTALVATGIEVMADVTELEVGETATFTATATFNNGTSKDVTNDVTITVFPADAATVSGNTVTVTKDGEIMVTISYGSVSESIVLTATKPAQTGLRGDVNCDGSVRMNDLILLLSHLSSGTELSAQGMVNADVNGDGEVRMNDLIGLLSFLSTSTWPF